LKRAVASTNPLSGQKLQPTSVVVSVRPPYTLEQLLKPFDQTGRIDRGRTSAMAKPGAASRSGTARGDTRALLVDAAIETLATQGFARTSARAIARTAGCNQALVFYHFGSVIELLLAALDEVSERRLGRYQAAAAGVTDPVRLVAVAGDIFREDLDNGYVTVLVEMIAGAAATPGLADEIAARIAPWRDFAQRTIEAGLAGSPVASLLPMADAAHAVVALYLGLDMLSHLEGDRDRATALFGHAGRLAALLQSLTPPDATKKDEP
jgi:AcrR family transcriptional regulator